ncbi:MAG: autotransporter outer membrane beta-barrel domain-containing protein, partial [Proteobacteria bacterium]|nr:autotransporter outer membrane beta-barrel domain-containing protein [Pseudomonadota bacterium]
LADVLAPLTATATGDLSDLLVALENVTTVKEFEANLEELAPVAQITMLGQSFQLAGMFGEAVDLRLSEARAVFRALAQGVMDPDDPATWPLLASNGDLAALGSGFFLSDDRRTSIYLRLLHDQGGETGQETYFGNSFFSTGVSGGVDRLLTQGLAIGGNLAMATTEVEYDDAGESGAEITSWSLGGYASRFGQEWHVNAQALAGYNQYKVDRKIAFLARTAESTYNSIMLSASLSGGYDLPLGAWTISPAASVEYARLAQQGYEEQGAGVANLTVAAQNANSLATGLGLGVSRKCETETLVIVPELWALWTHEFFTRDMTVDTSMAGNPSQVYSMRGAEPDRDVFRLGTGITLQADNGSSFSLRYQGDFSEHTWSNGGVLEYRVTF